MSDSIETWISGANGRNIVQARANDNVFHGVESMQSYLYIGGNQDSLSVPTPDGAESVQTPIGVTGRETYTRSTLSVGDVSVTIYIHESLTSEEVINRLVGHYKAWAVNQPGGRR